MAGTVNGNATYPVASTPFSGARPSPEYSGVFIPALWSGRILRKFYDATVLGAISNTDYEGEIRNKGDKVIIRTKPTLTIRDYQVDQDLVLERPSSNVIELPIDQGDYFAAVLDDVMRVQSDLNLLDMWSDDASEQMKITVDRKVLAAIPAGVAAANKGLTAGRISQDINLGVSGTPLTITPRETATTGDKTIMDLIVDMGTVLDEQNIPESGRWLILPAWACGMLQKSELRDASLSGDGTSIFRNGRIGVVNRFTVYMSNLLPTSGSGPIKWHFLAGHSHGLTFASQLTQLQTIVSERTFGTVLRGLQVYGYKAVDGTALVDAFVVKGT